MQRPIITKLAGQADILVRGAGRPAKQPSAETPQVELEGKFAGEEEPPMFL